MLPFLPQASLSASPARVQWLSETLGLTGGWQGGERCWISAVPFKVRSGATARGPVITRNLKGENKAPRLDASTRAV